MLPLPAIRIPQREDGPFGLFSIRVCSSGSRRYEMVGNGLAIIWNNERAGAVLVLVDILDGTIDDSGFGLSCNIEVLNPADRAHPSSCPQPQRPASPVPLMRHALPLCGALLRSVALLRRPSPLVPSGSSS